MQVGQEIRHQKLHGLEDIPFLAILNVSIIALASFMVIADETLTICSVEKTVLELMSVYSYLRLD
jgi:hypothetical protein